MVISFVGKSRVPMTFPLTGRLGSKNVQGLVGNDRAFFICWCSLLGMKMKRLAQPPLFLA